MAFKVPESLRLPSQEAHPLLQSTAADGNNGAFASASLIVGWVLLMIASDGDGWEHVSVHCANAEGKKRTPTWGEMCFVKDLFWGDEDEVVQYHPKRSEYVNLHPYTLHLWRPIGQELLRPPTYMIGPKL